ncbi:gamma-glutamylcyclotransferase family protein [Legionella anisa]|uniref:Gamma-glutamylcyclotransferase n=1 Tax=Legionella anisa TaxID=28082 RepID=A0AAX0WTB5_9GAMM|nr:gamma-glutamylcyclotransferase family protein [Legionella anisa]AWN74266.1 gamma-glutamylcyclotransferase [Legionella anisa]KTC72058.1 AIG2-like family protein [Legionella anisa]MBN5934289.1 gamma-glutamylcyclotransferase [Legionella anisa]MCW8425699.1 gamma-glutamylcyclotransferase [Legionella anisa]MCW8448872.1 gamma-glutamylcyclotransferase [Legionella anisa]
MNTEKLFSYGTLRYEAVQLSNFGRKLHGTADTLPGFGMSKIKIKDIDVITTSGDEEHPIITYTGKFTDSIEGMVFDVSIEELKKADSYEVEDYKRVKVKLASGVFAWVYVHVESVE